MRNLLAAASGSLFGLGLMISGMTDPRKVQGWLDFFGAWDPTLAFVLTGAILPMLVAWRFTPGRQPLLGGSFPSFASSQVDRDLIVGSLLFGLGWGLAGLCPGPSMVSLSYGYAGVWIFVASMIVGMILAPRTRRSLDALAAAS